MEKLHYICLGECNGVSDVPGECGSEGCSMYGKPLTTCSCEEPEAHKDSSSEGEEQAE